MVESFIPKTLHEALEYIANNDAILIAGGTDLMILKRNTAGLLPKFDKNVCFLTSILELKRVYKDDEYLYIGSTATLSELINNDLIPDVLKKLFVDMASPNIRNSATLGGNVANASPAGDGIVGLNLLDAKVKVTSIRGSRIIPIEDFVKGVRKIDLNADELIEQFIIPLNFNLKTMWKKVGGRKADAISKISFLGGYRFENGGLKDIRIALGAVYIKTVRSKDIEKSLLNLSKDEILSKLDEILKAYDELIKPIDDVRSDRYYRKKVALNLIKKFFIEMEM